MPVASGSSVDKVTPETLAERIRALSEEFALTLKGNLEEMRSVWASIQTDTSSLASAPNFVRMHEIAHSLAGAGKSLGFPRVSQAAAPLDSLFRLLREKQSPLTEEEVDQINLLITDLELAIDIPGEQVRLDIIHPHVEESPDQNSVFHTLLFADLSENGDAITLLKDVGFETTAVTGGSPPERVSRGEPAVLLSPLASVAEARGWLTQCGLEHDVPVVAVGERGTFHERLDSVRQGAADFLFLPLDREDVFSRLSAIEERLMAPPIRVVIAEDDQTLAEFYKLTLEHAGMEAKIVREPETILNELAGTAADIILMDLYLGSCTGLELAQIVRQFSAYTTVPILFLSTESRITLQLEARHLGADDFLVKPLKPAQLVSAVMSRAQRYRDLKKLTDRDSLTGLLNHTNILRSLDREISSAARTETHVVMAMVDIDHFKKVNDTYGHAVGDQVLLRVTHLIRNRLRRTDLVGRYGGEEFAVVMPNTTLETATAILEELREACAEIDHNTDQGSFKITFSAGAADFPNIETGNELAQAADECLYEAKRTGRNKVVTVQNRASA